MSTVTAGQLARGPAEPAQAIETVADADRLKARLRKVEARAKRNAFLLVLPLLLFLAVTFLVPIGQMLWRSVDNPEVVETIPRTLEALEGWDGQDLPGESVYATLAEELAIADENRTLGSLGTRLNYAESGMSSLLRKTGRRIDRVEAPFKAAFLDIDDDWGEVQTFQVIQQLGHAYTASYYLNALDYQRAPDGGIEAQPEWRQIYVQLFVRTLWLSALITGLCFVLGYPIAYLLATLPAKSANLLLILVLLPFWTSLLVRTTSWIVLLQTEGVLNDLMVWLGVLTDEGRLTMIYNRTGTIVAMTHILLPFMVLPLYSVMKTINPSHYRAALSLGARPPTAFFRVYFPQTVPGIGAGGLLVFILAIGYYITPALVGGRDGQLISNAIADHMLRSLNWGLAAALATLLLAAVLVLYGLYARLVGVNNMKLG